jgi:hypothetical protein
MQHAAILAASQPALRSLPTRAVWPTRHDLCVLRVDRLSLGGINADVLALISVSPRRWLRCRPISRR